MGILRDISRFFFQKTSNDFDANEAFRRNQQRYNALYALDPDVLVRHLSAFERGDICGLERVLDEFELREDKMRIGSFKMGAAVSSKRWEVMIRKGEEENPRAKVHQEHLTRFWNRIEATDAFCRNRKGGLRLLVKQMMQAQSRVYSVHDITWKVNGDGTLSATFTHVPAWCFENRTGRLRYIRNDGQTDGEEMRDGEWLVTVGEGVGIPAAIIAMAKRLSWNDWLLFSEKCGMPVIIGKTSAQRGTAAWDQLSRAIRAVAPKTGLVADTGSDLSAVPMGAGSGKDTYRELVEVVDRSISALYRGGDLATVSSGPDSAGVNAQDGESELMDGDGCAMVSETLRDQVEKFVIRFECGDFEPLAEIVIDPSAEADDVKREMEIDNHLAGLGVKLSKKDALARYGRTEAEDEADALVLPSAPVTDPDSQKLTAQDIASLIYPLRAGGYKISQPVVERATGLKLEEITPGEGVDNGKTQLANERPATTAFKTDEDAFKNARRVSDGQGDPPGQPPSQIAKIRPSGAEGVLEAFAEDTTPAAKAVQELLQDFSKEACEKFLAELPKLVPDDPVTATVLADAMAEAMASQLSPSSQGELANEEVAEVLWLANEDREANGEFAPKGTGNLTQGNTETPLQKRQRRCKESLEAYKASTDHPSADDVANGTVPIEEALKKGFEATFGGQKVIFFTPVIAGHYQNRGEDARLGMIKHVLGVRSNMFPTRHSGEQIGLVERPTSKNAGNRHVVTADRETGIAVNVMRCSDAYIKKHYK